MRRVMRRVGARSTSKDALAFNISSSMSVLYDVEWRDVSAGVVRLEVVGSSASEDFLRFCEWRQHGSCDQEVATVMR